MSAFSRYGKYKWIYLPIEIKVREFDSKVLTACSAAEKGYSAVVGWAHAIRPLLSIWPDGVYFEKSISAHKFGLINSYRERGHRVVCLDEEGLGCHYAAFFNRERLSSKTLEITDIYFTWGDEQKDVVLSAYPEAVSKVINSGNPRVDLWASSLCEIYREKANEYRDKYGSYILVPSNFSSVVNASGPNYQINFANKCGIIKEESDAEYYNDLMKYRSNGLNAYLDMIDEVAMKFNDTNVIHI